MSRVPKTIRLTDYRPSDYFIDTTAMDFKLEPQATRVKTKLTLRPNMNCNPDATRPLILDGKDISLITISMNNRILNQSEYTIDENTLSIPRIDLLENNLFEIETEVEIHPDTNTSLEGLYISNGMFCTQCEAEGFRRITYYLDRPDIMSKFSIYMDADQQTYPVLLSNGNPVETKELENNRHFAKWVDPYPKPSYLFALVAGDLYCHEDFFITKHGNKVTLRIFVEKKDLNKIDHAMHSLKQAFAWDEKTYNRLYDLDIFNIVAVSHFNMGAMENKSLNIFNTSCVLANPETATDAAHDRVRDVIAHEYFHNWSGNRVTCRDWHQLSLKEGFTVYRDASFSADHGSPVVKRIEDATQLRTFQFKEDSGPTAHAVLPKEVQSFDNFYTLTIYEKGAEIIGMYRTLLGSETFFKGTELYFNRHDGQAVTIEDFSKAMEDASGTDLSQFRLWYHQAGTPHVTLSGEYNESRKTFLLHAEQTCRPTPETQDKKPFVIPLRIGLLDQNGLDIPLRITQKGVVNITESKQTFTFNNVPHKPIPSLFRHFSAPVTYFYPYTREELLFLMKNDSDGFNRWDACRKLAETMLLEMISDDRNQASGSFIEAYRTLLTDNTLDKAMVAEMLRLPGEAYLSQRVDEIDPDAIHQSREKARQAIAESLQSELVETYKANENIGPYDLAVEHKARRALRNICLSYLCALELPEYLKLAKTQYYSAGNMTDKQAAFTLLAHSKTQIIRKKIITDFYETYNNDKLIINTWFQTQAISPLPGTLDVVKNLLVHPAFDPKSPNDIRSIVGAFASNAKYFHSTDGLGYVFLSDYIIRLNSTNPQIAARLVIPFAQWKKYNAHRQQLMKKELERIVNLKGLSTNIFEQVSRCLLN
ncbi:MAG: aminopeptidase N [Desulfobacteraceae bacterium]|nr:MAG: aminopeptidase N [Desulfobacteraceae bacterium]